MRDKRAAPSVGLNSHCLPVSPLRVPETQSTSRQRAQQNTFRRRDVRLQSRSFARWNQSLDPPSRREFPPVSACQASIPSAPIGCCAQIGCMRGEITRMEIRRRLGLLEMNHLRAREDEHEDWREPPPFCSVRSWGNFRTTKFRSFSLVYL